MSLIKIYMEGFNDCFFGINKSSRYESAKERLAYDFGWNDYVVGDDVSSLDYQLEEEILKRIESSWVSKKLPR